MDDLELDLTESTKHFGHHWEGYAKVYLLTHYRCYKDEEQFIKSITKTVAHEELHIVLRRFGIRYTKNEELVFKRLQRFLYPELFKSS